MDDGASDDSDAGEDNESALSSAAIEAELKPAVLVTFHKIADRYNRIRRLQDQDINKTLHDNTLSSAGARSYRCVGVTVDRLTLNATASQTQNGPR